MSHVLEGSLATLKFLLERCALRPAHLDEVILGILTLLDHAFDSASNVVAHQYNYTQQSTPSLQINTHLILITSIIKINYLAISFFLPK